MKKAAIASLFALILASFTAVTIYAVSTMQKSSVSDAAKLIAALPLSQGEVKFVNTITDAYDNQIEVYADTNYQYQIQMDDQSISGIILQDAQYQSLDEHLSAQAQAVSETALLERCTAQTKALLSHWNWDNVTIETTWHEQSNVDYLSLSVLEQSGDDDINSGLVSFAKDGSLVSCFASANTAEDFAIPSNLSERDLRSMIFADLTQRLDFDETANNQLVATNGDELTLLSMRRTMRNNQLVWEIEVLVETTYGLADEIFNPVYCYTIDALTGDIAEVIST